MEPLQPPQVCFVSEYCFVLAWTELLIFSCSLFLIVILIFKCNKLTDERLSTGDLKLDVGLIYQEWAGWPKTKTKSQHI